LKIGPHLLAVAVFGMSMAQPISAKETHGHRGGHRAASATPKSTKGGRPAAKGANSKESRPGDTSNAGIPALPPGPPVRPDKGRDKNPGLKIGMPGHLEGRRVPAPRLPGPVTRNAIGQPVTAHENTPGGGERFKSAVQTPAAPGGIGGLAKVGAPSPGRPSAPPIATASFAAPSKIAGTGLPVRSQVVGTGIGGPARAVVGINGTTLRAKR
jgi:hypothetical protein